MRNNSISSLGWLRRAPALLLLFVFALQSYFIAAHIHATATAQLTVSSGYLHSPAPVDKEDPDNCPICQAFALAGSFVVPVTIVFSIAVLVTDATPPAAPSSSLASRHRHSWQSRAPPI
jgi:hypothetical protein